MPKNAKKQRMIRIRGTKEKKEKDMNKIKQSVKINITTSGGGGSGGSGIPSIPQPIYNSMQGQKTGENVETNNLLKQLLKTQEPIQRPLYYANPNKENATPLLKQINSHNNNNDIDDEALFINTNNLFNKDIEDESPTPQTPSSPIIRRGRPQLTEEQRIINQQMRENDK